MIENLSLTNFNFSYRSDFPYLGTSKTRTMKMNLLSLTFALSTGIVMAQTTPIVETPFEEIVTYNSLGQKVITTKAIGFQKTLPVTEWGQNTEPQAGLKEQKDKRGDFDMEGYEEALAFKDSQDPVVQTEMGTRQLRAPIVNFAGA